MTTAHRLQVYLFVLVFHIGISSPTFSGTILRGNGLVGGLRWDAMPRSILGLERSLSGGLRYSLQGGSFEAYRNLFTWDGLTPSVSDFQQAVERAFAAWETIDPVTGLATGIYFVQDLSTRVVGTGTFGTVNLRGAEIDLFGYNGGPDGFTGVAAYFFDETPVTLTSGTPAYPGTKGLAGVDIQMNTAKAFTLHGFRRTLTHEIGHAIGLGDLETDVHPEFIDDNFDGTNSETALTTLTNSWALLIDPFDPAASPISVYTVPNGDPGIDTEGVDLLMERNNGGRGPTNPESNLMPLTNDEYAMRQFLYPFVVPEPSCLILFVLGSLLIGTVNRRRLADRLSPSLTPNSCFGPSRTHTPTMSSLVVANP